MLIGKCSQRVAYSISKRHKTLSLKICLQYLFQIKISLTARYGVCSPYLLAIVQKVKDFCLIQGGV